MKKLDRSTEVRKVTSIAACSCLLVGASQLVTDVQQPPNLDLLYQSERDLNINAKVTNGVFDLEMTEQNLNHLMLLVAL